MTFGDPYQPQLLSEAQQSPAAGLKHSALFPLVPAVQSEDSFNDGYGRKLYFLLQSLSSDSLVSPFCLRDVK